MPLLHNPRESCDLITIGVVIVPLAAKAEWELLMVELQQRLKDI